MKKKKYNYITAACFAALGVYVICESASYSNKGIGQQNPGLWPTCLAVLMIVCSAILVIQTALKKDEPKAEREQDALIEKARKEAEAKGEEFDEKGFVLKLKQKEVDAGGLMAELSGGEEEDIDWKSPGMKRAYAAIGMTIGFFIIQYFFGMLIGLACLIPGIMWLMNTKKPLVYIITDAGIIAFVYIFFAKVMTITLPTGILF